MLQKIDVPVNPFVAAGTLDALVADSTTTSAAWVPI